MCADDRRFLPPACPPPPQGWSSAKTLYKFKDGKSYNCQKKCSKCSDWRYEPALYDPDTERWSAAGSLAPAVRPRGYHSTAILLPSCEVMVGGELGRPRLGRACRLPLVEVLLPSAWRCRRFRCGGVRRQTTAPTTSHASTRLGRPPRTQAPT